MRNHATIQDIKAIGELCLEARDLSQHYSHLIEDYDKAADNLAAMIMSPRCYVGFNGDGVLIASASDAWWHSGLLITEHFFYARKNGLPLLREFMQWAKAFPGNNEIYVGATFGGDKGAVAERIYKRLGLTPTGTIWKVN